jgi:hypothetical protein
LYSPATIDEVRVANTGYSADLIKAGYRNTTDTLATYGSEETSSSTGDAWCSDATGVTCDSDWNYRRRVEFINSTSATNLGDDTASNRFTVLVKLSTALGNIDYAKTKDNGEDIRFVDHSNTSLVLNHEIETWNESGESFVWVRVPQIDAGKNSDYMYMYYGNSNASAPDSAHATGTWDSSTQGVWHMKDTGSTNLADSTTNAFNVTKVATNEPVAATGQINGAQTFDGSNDGAGRITAAAMLKNVSAASTSAWVSTSSDTATFKYISEVTTTDIDDSRLQIRLSNTETLQCVAMAGDAESLQTASGSTTVQLVPGTSYHVACVVNYATDSIDLYVNGQLIADSGTIAFTATSTSNTDSARQSIGYSNGTTTSFLFPGTIDEVRVAATNRSAGWMDAEYRSGANYMNTYGSEELSPPAAPTLTAFTGQQSTTPTFQLRASDPAVPNWLRYKIEVCSNADCSTVLRTIDQSTSQTGWTGQDANSNTAYVGSATLASSTLASHTYQTPALANGTTYWWRAYATDDLGGVSSPSSISSFQTLAAPATPTLVNPADTATGVPLTPDFRLWTTDLNGDNVKYLIDVCDTASCTDTDGGGPLVGVYRAIDQQSSQTGWAAQNAESGASYTAHPTTLASGSQQAVHVYQLPKLSPNTQYWWRAKAYDPTGSNMSSSYSSIWSFTTNPNNDSTRIQGGTKITGGTTLR